MRGPRVSDPDRTRWYGAALVWQTGAVPATSSSTRRPTRRLSVEDWVTAALKLIGDEGLPAVKIDRLAQQLGVTKGSFYWHFDDLSAFLSIVAARWCEDRKQLRVTLAELDEVPADERLMRLFDRVTDPSYWRLERAAREWARTNRRVRDTIARSDGWILDAHRAAFRELGFDEPEAELRANTLVYAALGFILAGPRDARADRRQVDGLIGLLVAHPAR